MMHLNSAPIINFAIGHENAVRALAFSSDGRYLASGGLDGIVNIWDANSMSVWRLTESWKSVRALAFSEDGKYLVIAGDAMEKDLKLAASCVSLWDLDAGSEVGRQRAPADVVSFDGSTVLLASDNTLTGFRVPHDFQLGSFYFHGPKVPSYCRSIRALVGGLSSPRFAISRDGRIVARITDKLELIETDSSAIIWTLHDCSASCVAFSSNDDKLLTGTFDGRLDGFHSANGEPSGSHQLHEDALTGVAFSSASPLVATGSEDGEIRLWDSRDWSLIRRLTPGKLLPERVISSQSPPGLLFLDADGCLVDWTWRPDGTRNVSVVPLKDSLRRSCVALGRYRRLVCGEAGRLLEVDPTTGQAVGPVIELGAVTMDQLHVARNRRDVICICRDDEGEVSLHRCDLLSGAVSDVASLEVKSPWPVAISQDGDSVGVMLPDAVKVWSISMRAWRYHFPYDFDAPNGRLSISVGGSHIAITMSGEWCRILNTHRSDAPVVFSRATFLAWGPSRQRVLLASTDGTNDVVIGDLDSGECKKRWKGHRNKILDAACWGPFVVTCGQDGRRCIWDPKSETLKATLVRIGEDGDRLGGWLSWTPDGEVAGSPGTEKLVSLIVNGAVVQLPIAGSKEKL